MGEFRLLSGLRMAAVALSVLAASAAWADTVTVVSKMETDKPGGLYVGNKAPLKPSALMKLPIGAITPQGWLRNQLQLEADGMSGHLEEISTWLKWEGNSWTDPEGKGHSGWEEMPYWLKGYGDLGYVLKDEKIIKNSEKWIEAILKNQDTDGWIGPRGLKTSIVDKRATNQEEKARPDLWPTMLILNILQSHYERTGDARVIPYMTKYFKWQLEFPEQDFMAGYWPKMRIGDNIESIYWLYNRTGEKWLLDVATKVHTHGANWTDGMPNWHGVNVTQGFREPATYWMQSGDAKHLRGTERNYETFMGLYGQVPGGGFGADENCRPGQGDPRQGFETCSIVEFTHSFQMLTKITGNPLWADRCEEVAFNIFPAALTPDWKGLHYLTSPNQVQLDKNNKAPGIQNHGTMFSYSPFQVYRCCQHNVGHGWPYYAEELWLATYDNGLCASLYAASEVQAKVGDGTQVKITEETQYPFEETVSLKVATPKSVAFPLYVRVPRWCEKPQVKVNGKAVEAAATPLSYIRIDRTWADGDTVVLDLPMRLGVRTWAKNQNAVSVDYGPLTFSLKIGEKWTKYGKNEKWPEWEVMPTTPWNYGLVLDSADPAKGMELVKVKQGPLAEQPFTPENVPLAIKAKARKIPGWTADKSGMINKLMPSPVASTEPEETVTLIPMGAARLRISAFPTIGNGNNAPTATPAEK